MGRKLNKDERGEYKALHEHYLFYVDRAAENIMRGGSENKYVLILGYMADAIMQKNELKVRAYGN